MTALPFGPSTTHTPSSATARGRAVADAFHQVQAVMAEESAWEILRDPFAPHVAVRRACRIVIDATHIAARRAAAETILARLEGEAETTGKD